MKFYYKGQLIRTSKTHHYTHACVAMGEDGKWNCVGCSSTKAGAEKVKQDIIREVERCIFTCNSALKALDEGKAGFYNSRHVWHKFDEGDTKEYFSKILEDEKNRHKGISENYLIVEIEEA